MVQTLVPENLTLVLPTERLNARGMPVGDLRSDLRSLSGPLAAWTIAFAWVQTFGVVALAGYLNTWWSYLLAYVLMTRGHACLNILGHEAAHRLLLPSQRLNDWFGRWTLGFPSLLAFSGYRRVHFAHHKDEMGPNEPDLRLYAGYPIERDSWIRKLKRDLIGISAYKNITGLFRALKAGKGEAWAILGVQLVLLAGAILVQRPLMYLVWLASWCTTWKVSNRLRSIAEHGGMKRSEDRRETTHVIEQSRWWSFWIAPYNTGYHLAHHADMGVPWRNLPRLHQELVGSGWVTPEITYSSYWEFWRVCSSGDSSPVGTGESTTSFLSF